MSPLKRTTRLVTKTGLKRTSQLARRTPLAEVGRKTQSKGRKPRRNTGPNRAIRELVLERDDYTCALCGKPILHQPYSLQHRRAKGMGGTSRPDANSPAVLVTLCGSATSPDGCHLWCEQRNAEAEDMGFVIGVNSDIDLATVPVHHYLFGVVYLLHDGTVGLVPHVDGEAA